MPVDAGSPEDDDGLLDRSSDGLALAGVSKKAPLMIRSWAAESGCSSNAIL